MLIKLCSYDRRLMGSVIDEIQKEFSSSERVIEKARRIADNEEYVKNIWLYMDIDNDELVKLLKIAKNAPDSDGPDEKDLHVMLADEDEVYKGKKVDLEIELFYAYDWAM